MLCQGRYLSGWFSVWHTIVGCPTVQPLTKPGCPEPLAIELFTFTPRKLGKHQNLHVACAQVDFEEFMLWDLKFLWGCVKRKNMLAGTIVVPCVLNVSVTGSSALSSLRRRKSLWKCWKHKHRIRKLNLKNKASLSNMLSIMPSWSKFYF